VAPDVEAVDVGPDAEAGVGAGGPTATGEVASSAAEVWGADADADAGAAADGAGAREGAESTTAPDLSMGITSPGSFMTS
jgi:hypothetical protein